MIFAARGSGARGDVLERITHDARELALTVGPTCCELCLRLKAARTILKRSPELMREREESCPNPNCCGLLVLKEQRGAAM